MSKLVDETGNRYGRWLVLERWPESDRGAIWLCKCDCGTVRPVKGIRLRIGGSQGCGCERNERIIEHNQLASGEASLNAAILHYKKQAEARNISWYLTKEDFKRITSLSCHYCGKLPSKVINRDKYNGNYVHSGIDRKDNDRGYAVENSVPCCKDCNYAKRKMSYDNFLTWIRRVYINFYE